MQQQPNWSNNQHQKEQEPPPAYGHVFPSAPPPTAENSNPAPTTTLFTLESQQQQAPPLPSYSREFEECPTWRWQSSLPRTRQCNSCFCLVFLFFWFILLPAFFIGLLIYSYVQWNRHL